LHNSGPARKLDLLFVAGSEELSDFEVRLGDHLLASNILTYDQVTIRLHDMPTAWKPPVVGAFLLNDCAGLCS
jgi:hypothetical protein